MSIIISNSIMIYIIQQGTQFTRPVNEQALLTDSIIAITGIQFINLGLFFILIFMRIRFLDRFFLGGDVLNGDFEDFTAMWYINVGT